jgi:tRNA G10  N-methylase Trm11
VIAEQTGGRLNARGGGNSVEYWIVGRRDLDQFLLCQRLTTGTKKASPRGALTTDLATLLVKASGPRPDDVFLDPFAGSGALVAARLNWPLRKAILSDIKTAELPRRITASRQVAILHEDALQLPSVRDESVTALVTDPPWSEYEQVETPYEDFADAMLASFDRVLHPQRGRLVVLLARRLTDVVTKAWERSLLELPDSHEVLVNGHPATVLVGGRPRLR